jgi:hypothetical protein
MLKFPQLVNKFPAFYETRRLITVLTTARQLREAVVILYGEESLSPNLKDGGPPLIGCRGCLFALFESYASYPEAVKIS